MDTRWVKRVACSLSAEGELSLLDRRACARVRSVYAKLRSREDANGLGVRGAPSIALANLSAERHLNGLLPLLCVRVRRLVWANRRELERVHLLLLCDGERNMRTDE